MIIALFQITYLRENKMKKFFFVFLILFSIPLFAQDNFVRGVFMFFGYNADYTQIHDSLHVNWIQAVAEGDNGNKYNNVLQNIPGLNVMGEMRNVIYPKSSAQRMVFYTEPPNTNDYSFFAYTRGTPEDSLLEVAVQPVTW